MLVTDTLLVDADTLDGQDPIFLAKPASIELIVWNSEEEDDTDYRGQESSEKEDNLPAGNGSRMDRRSTRDSISDKTAENLRKAVERKPDASPRALLGFRIPLAGNQRETGRHCGFQDTEEKSDCDGAGKVRHSSEACQYYAPHDHTEGAVLGQWQTL